MLVRFINLLIKLYLFISFNFYFHLFVYLGTDNSESAQIIIPAREVRRRNDIYVAIVSHSHLVASKGMFIAIVSTTVETNNPIAELNPGLALLGQIAERFFYFKI